VNILSETSGIFLLVRSDAKEDGMVLSNAIAKRILMGTRINTIAGLTSMKKQAGIKTRSESVALLVRKYVQKPGYGNIGMRGLLYHHKRFAD
jgi:hypothetical protein